MASVNNLDAKNLTHSNIDALKDCLVDLKTNILFVINANETDIIQAITVEI